MEDFPIECSSLSTATDCRNTCDIIIDDEAKEVFRMFEITPLESIDDRVDLILKLDHCPDRLFKMNGECDLEKVEVNAILRPFLTEPITGGLHEYNGYTAYSSLEYDGFEVHINNRLLQRVIN